MLCFVQTDAVVADPEAALRARRRGLVRADHRRRPDEHQRHGPAAGDRRRRARRCPTGLLDAVLLQLALEIVADGEGATRVGRVEVTERGERRGGRAGRARDRQLAAGQDGALRPRPELGPDRAGGRAWRWPARSSTSSARTQIDADGARRRRAPRPRSRSRSAAATPRAHIYFSRPHPRVHPDQRGVHDMTPSSRRATPASRRCSRRCPTSASSTGARW